MSRRNVLYMKFKIKTLFLKQQYYSPSVLYNRAVRLVICED